MAFITVLIPFYIKKRAKNAFAIFYLNRQKIRQHLQNAYFSKRKSTILILNILLR